MTPEPNNVAFVQRIENARSFKINPLEEIVVTVPSEPTKHAFCMVEHRSAPNAAPPLHLHRNEDEIFEILEGQFRFWLDGEIVEASPGTIVVAPRNGTHTWKNVGGALDGCPLLLSPAGLMDFSMTWRSFLIQTRAPPSSMISMGSCLSPQPPIHCPLHPLH